MTLKFFSSQKAAAVYYGASLLLMVLFPSVGQLFHEKNLPPLEPPVRFFINLVFLNLGAAYAWLIFPKKQMALPSFFWLYFFLIGIAICLVPPVFSGDLYEYLIRGRILGIYHQNPYAHVSGEFPQDPFFAFSIWTRTPDNYGPAWVLIQWIMPTLFGGTVPLAAASQKILLFGFLLSSGLIFNRIAVSVYPSKAAGLTQAFVLNPNLWVQHILDGHNDIVMVFWMLLAAYFLLRSRWFFGVLAATLAVLVKYSSLFLLPVLFIAAIRKNPEWGFKQKFIFMIKGCAVAAGTTAALYLPFWIGQDTFKYFFVFKEWFYTNSVPYAFYLFFTKLGVFFQPVDVKRFFMLFFLGNAFLAMAWFFLKRSYAPASFFRTMTWIFLALHASYAIPFYGNHLSWSIPFLILSDFPLAPVAVTLVSLAGIFAYFKRLSFLYLLAIAVYLGAVVLWKGLGRRGEKSWAVSHE